jgi:hypothetical protein
MLSFSYFLSATRRRLYDIANILSCLHLVVKFQTAQGPGYLWLGVGGLQERLREFPGKCAFPLFLPKLPRKLQKGGVFVRLFLALISIDMQYGEVFAFTKLT